MWVNRLMFAVVWVGAVSTCTLGVTDPVLINPSFDSDKSWYGSEADRWYCEGADFAVDRTIYRSAPAAGRMTSSSSSQVYTEQWFDTPETMPNVGDTIVFSIWLKSNKTWTAGRAWIDIMTTLDNWQWDDALCIIREDRRTLTAEWQQYSVWGVRKSPLVTKMYFHILATAPGTIWMDDASVARKGSTSVRHSPAVAARTRAILPGPARTVDIRGRLIAQAAEARGLVGVSAADGCRLLVGGNHR